MHFILLSALAETAFPSSQLWVLAASAVPLALLAGQKNKNGKKLGFLKRWLLKMMLKWKKPKKGLFGKLLIGLIIAFAITALFSLLIGWLWASVVVGALIILQILTKKEEWGLDKYP